jgi:hypothetical protein
LQKLSLHRLLGAWALTLIFAATCSLKSVHSLLLHHDHHADHPVCEAAYSHDGLHLHDERYNPDDCSLCAFVLSVPEMISIPVFQATIVKLPDSAPASFYHAPVCSKTACDITRRRGPPTA